MAKWLVVLLALCGAAAWSQTAPSDSVAVRPLSATSATDKQIQALQDHVKKQPGNYARL